MRRLMMLLLCAGLAGVTLTGRAEPGGVETRLILLQGDKSSLMDGDPYAGQPKPLNYHRNRVLPFFLSQGWIIRSVHINERSSADNPYGYVVIERPLKQVD